MCKNRNRTKIWKYKCGNMSSQDRKLHWTSKFIDQSLWNKHLPLEKIYFFFQPSASVFVVHKRMNAPAINNSLCCIDFWQKMLFIVHVNVPNCSCAKTQKLSRKECWCMCNECKQDGHQRHLSYYSESLKWLNVLQHQTRLLVASISSKQSVFYSWRGFIERRQ